MFCLCFALCLLIGCVSFLVGRVAWFYIPGMFLKSIILWILFWFLVWIFVRILVTISFWIVLWICFQIVLIHFWILPRICLWLLWWIVVWILCVGLLLFVLRILFANAIFCQLFYDLFLKSFGNPFVNMLFVCVCVFFLKINLWILSYSFVDSFLDFVVDLFVVSFASFGVRCVYN